MVQRCTPDPVVLLFDDRYSLNYKNKTSNETVIKTARAGAAWRLHFLPSTPRFVIASDEEATDRLR